jgi:hypothetical protein
MICDTARRARQRQEVEKLRLEQTAQQFLQRAGLTSKLAGPPRPGMQFERACTAVP